MSERDTTFFIKYMVGSVVLSMERHLPSRLLFAQHYYFWEARFPYLILSYLLLSTRLSLLSLNLK